MRQFFFVLVIISIETFAYSAKEGNVTAAVGPYIYKTRYENSAPGGNSPYLGGESLIVNGDINTNGALEIGIFHFRKIFFREQGASLISEQTELMHITMGYRRYLNSVFSTSLSFYSSYSMGDPVIVHNDFTPASQIDTSARDITEYGLDLALQAELYSRDRYSVVLDGRYSVSLTSKPNERSDHYGAILALRYLAQEKEAPKP